MWRCPLDELPSPPTRSRQESCGDNNHAPPAGSWDGAQNPYAKVLSGRCFGRIWRKLLQAPVSSAAFPGQCRPLHDVLQHYSDESKPSIMVSLMNEPNMLETAELAASYADVLGGLRSAPFGMQNRVLLESNYWAGLHAQVTPADRSSAGGCGAPSSTTQGKTAGLPAKSPIEVLHDAISALPAALQGKWSVDVHQYFDYFSTGNSDCGQAWPESTDAACAAGSMDAVRNFTNWGPFIAYCKANDISIAVTEFGGHPTARCAGWITSFLSMLEADAYQDGKGGVLLWTAWRTCPHTSWYSDLDDPSQIGVRDCIQFAAPQPYDPPEYAAVYRLTSADGVANSIKAALRPFVHA